MLPSSLISSDSHVVEREFCYSDVDPKFRDRIPKDIDMPDGGAGIHIDGMFTLPFGGVCAAGRSPEKMYRPMPWDEVNPAAFDSKTRLEAQDIDGVRGEVIFPSVGMFLHPHPDPDFQKACFDAYNRWLAQYCAKDPERLIGVAQITLHTIDEGIRELEAAKAAGFRTVMLPGEPFHEDYDHPDYDAFWEACVDLNMPINFHILTGRKTLAEAGMEKPRGPSICTLQRFVRGNQDVIMLFVFGGVFDRHPKLKIVAVESDVSWMPHFAARMDNVYARYRLAHKATPLAKLPSQYLAENVYFTMQDDYPVGRMTDLLPMSQVMWANDFPHGDAVWPNSRDVLAKITATMSDSDVRLMVHDNVAKLYGLSI